jgi:hypothetical protein
MGPRHSRKRTFWHHIIMVHVRCRDVGSRQLTSSVAAVSDIGPWDTAFPQPNYHVDNNWFHRARLKGYEFIETGIQITHHNGSSSTIRGSEERRKVNDVTFPMNEE